jgi:arylsulfatase A-like enzyme
LVVRLPGAEASGARVVQEVSLRDVAATVLDLADAAGPGTLPGTSLAPLWEEGASTTEALSSVRARDGLTPRVDVWSLVRDSLHIIRFADGRTALHDLASDPQERINLFEDSDWRPVVDSLLGDLSRLADGQIPAAESTVLPTRPNGPELN